ncbi:dynamin family protein [Pseudofrankia inefficax]|uniref:GTP-binding protein HSR1-related protein n=1 Tax=Pseudofrankia inefficax (strain DSM 45817 / CECT 9037 / DDB 130130 / EuI1c) TaxID=298654 RepID=E3IVR0_PSEI1|nr:dynamin family protein [Pseudofrankia inefficax]ADP83712.1 GTP-binding protein HSR1-related protein [Pseudofrankia inefficax]
MRTPLCDQTLVLCAEAAERLAPGPARDAVTAVAERLRERTLRLAVGGRVNAGKSTLVNALLGQRLAATDATECTMVVTWFRHHHQNRIVVTPHAGEPFMLPPARGGGAPADLRLPREQIRTVTVEVANQALAARHILIDTPGLDSLTGLDEGSLAALADADALLYVTPHPGERDAEAIEGLRGTALGANLTAANVLGVLSRVDQLGDGRDDVWEQARRVAGRYAADLRGLVGDVVPVIGLLAQTAGGDEFTEADTRLLHQLAAADADDLDDALYSHADFLDWDTGPLRADDRVRLLRLLGTYGLRTCATLLAEGIAGTPRLLAALEERSGIVELRAQVERRFIVGADRLRATRALGDLETASWLGDDADARLVLAGLRSEIDRLRRDPVLRQAELAGALRELAAGRLRVDDATATALVAFATGTTTAARLGLPDGATPAQIAEAAGAWVRRWRELEASPSRLVVRYARAARELAEALYFETTG